MGWKRFGTFMMFLLTAATVTGSAMAAQDDSDEPAPVVGEDALRRAVAVIVDWDEIHDVLADFGDLQHPLGSEINPHPDAIRVDGVTWTKADLVEAGYDGTTPFDFFPEGDTFAGNSYTFGGFVDPSAVPGPLSIFSIVAWLPSGEVDQFLEFAILLELPGLPTATADPRLVFDPDEGFNTRFVIDNGSGKWNARFEQFDGDGWGEFQNTSDAWVNVNGSEVTVSMFAGPRFIEGAMKVEARVATVPADAVDLSQAWLTTARFGEPTVEELADLLALPSERDLLVAGEVMNGNPAAALDQFEQSGEADTDDGSPIDGSSIDGSSTATDAETGQQTNAESTETEAATDDIAAGDGVGGADPADGNDEATGADVVADADEAATADVGGADEATGADVVVADDGPTAAPQQDGLDATTSPDGEGSSSNALRNLLIAIGLGGAGAAALAVVKRRRVVAELPIAIQYVGDVEPPQLPPGQFVGTPLPRRTHGTHAGYPYDAVDSTEAPLGDHGAERPHTNFYAKVSEYIDARNNPGPREEAGDNPDPLEEAGDEPDPFDEHRGGPPNPGDPEFNETILQHADEEVVIEGDSG